MTAPLSPPARGLPASISSITLSAPHPALAEAARRLLGGLPHVLGAPAESGASGIDIAPDVNLEEAREVLGRMGAEHLSVSVSPSLPPGAVSIALAGDLGLTPVNLTVRSDCPRLAKEIADALAPFVNGTPRFYVSSVESAVGVRYGGAHPMIRAVARSLAGLRGRPAPESQAWGEEDQDLEVVCRSNEAVLGTVPVRIQTDDDPAGQALAGRVRALGFADVTVAPLARRSSLEQRFVFRPGTLSVRMSEPACAMLDGLLRDFLREAGVDEEAWPLTRADMAGGPSDPPRLRPDLDADTSLDALFAHVELPLARVRSGGLRPYSGFSPSRFQVEVRSNDRSLALSVARALDAVGFSGSRARGLLADDVDPYLEVADLATEVPLLELLERTIESVLPPGLPKPPRAPGTEGRVVRIILPVGLSEEERKERSRAHLLRYRVTVFGEGAAAFVEPLRAAGFRRVRAGSAPPRRGAEPGMIHVGGADVVAVQAVRSAMGGATPGAYRVKKVWPEADMDIYVYLAAGSSTQPALAPSAADLFAGWVGTGPGGREFVEVGPNATRVGRAKVPGPVGSAGPALDLAQYVVDGTTAETLEHLALSVARAEPVLLEGTTSTSKTSAILYLAALLGREVVRINLSAQTDTAELLGRYVPVPGPEGRASWRWVDGRIVRALRDGAWVVLDEINLGDPGVLERLNPLLEQPPSLVLSEHDGERFGVGGTAIHPHFHIFATMNPSSYGGRNALSPAFRDRFLGYRAVSPPSEADLRLMLRRLVLGAAAEVSAGGRSWSLPAITPPTPWHGVSRARVEAMLTQLARLYVSLSELGLAGDRADPGGEPPVYTRRGLLAVLRSVKLDLTVGVEFDRAVQAALLRYVVARARDSTERGALARVMDACGLGPSCWSPESPPPPVARPPAPEAGGAIIEDDDDDIPFYLPRMHR